MVPVAEHQNRIGNLKKFRCLGLPQNVQKGVKAFVFLKSSRYDSGMPKVNVLTLGYIVNPWDLEIFSEFSSTPKSQLLSH